MGLCYSSTCLEGAKIACKGRDQETAGEEMEVASKFIAESKAGLEAVDSRVLDRKEEQIPEWNPKCAS